MDSKTLRDSAFVGSTDVEGVSGNSANSSLDMLEQQQAREQARLLYRFRELRQWQQQQQEQLMQQQQLQLEMLRGEQLRVQTLLASQRGAHWGDGRVSKPDGFHKSSAPLITPPRRAGTGVGVGAEIAKTMRGVVPHASADSGLVASMGDTLEHPKDSLPRPVMYPSSPSADDDKYTNPELFSNPGSHGDDLQAVDDRLLFPDNRSDVSSDNFILPPLPPEPRDSNAQQMDNDGLRSLKTLQALMSTTAPNFLQQVLGLLPLQQKSLLLEQRQAVVEESASPNFSPVNPPNTARQSTSSVGVASSLPAPLSQDAFQGHGWDAGSFGSLLGRAPSRPQHSQSSQFQASISQGHRQADRTQSPTWQQDLHPEQLDWQTGQKQAHHHHHHHHHHQQFKDTDWHEELTVLQKQTHRQSQQQQQQQQQVPFQRQGVVRRSLQEDDREEFRGGQISPQEREAETEESEEEEELEVTVKECGSPDDRPISGVQGRKTFEQLLEEQLASELQKEEEKAAEAEKQTSSATRRPFLRKGQGIARFSKPIKKPPPKRSSGIGQKSDAHHLGTASRHDGVVWSGPDTGKTTLSTKPPVKRQPERKRVSGGKNLREKPEDEDPPQQEKLKLIKRRSESGRRVQPEPARDGPFSKHKGQTATAPPQKESGLEGEDKDAIPDDASFVAGMKERDKNAPMEAEELEEFEMLEDIADNMSLVSNSSVMARLVTPNKERQKTAVTDLKTVLEKKKSAASSPFERNAAMRSLLTVNVPCPPVGMTLPAAATQPPEDDPDQNSTLVEDNNENSSGSSDVSITESDDEDKKWMNRERVPLMHGDSLGGSDRVQNVLPAGLFPQPVNGLDFSSKFSLFDQQKQFTEGAGSAADCPASPSKSMTRKVATLQSRLSAANDTASLLQKLSAHAGFLSSGFSQSAKEKGAALLEEAGQDESQADSSLLSSARPQPLVIDGAGKSDETTAKHSALSSAENVDSAHWQGRTEYREDEQEDSEDELAEGAAADSEELDTKDRVQKVESAELGDRRFQWTADEVADGDGGSDDNTNNNAGFDDEEEWTSNAPKRVAGKPEEAAGAGMTSTPPTSKLMSRLFPNLKPKPTTLQKQQQQKLQTASAASVGDGVQSKILREKLAELEVEIEKFRSENAALEKLRRDREEGLSKLKEEIAHFEQEKSAELKRLEEFKAQETKKLKQERKLFETYQKQVRSMPDKKDREEIDMLKNQLSDLQDEMKRKESRWTSSVTRLKSRVSELEAENTELRDEMKLLERKRLEWMQTAKPAVAVSAAKSLPRSSTPTNVTNGYHVGASAMDVNNFNVPQKQSAGSAEKAAVPAATAVNGSGAAGNGRMASVAGSQHAAGGESVPRGQAHTPSMIEGMSPLSLGDGSESCSTVDKKLNIPMAADRPTVDKGNRQYEETQYPDGKVERVYSNGSREVLFANGTRKEIAADGQYIIVSFFNGDVKQIFPDQHVVYYYAEAQTTHTTYPDRLEVLQFSNGQTEKHYPDGTKEITFPDQTVKYLFPNGTEESIFQDGTIMRIDKNGERTLEFPNGQREIHTQQYKRREYPDGTVKTLHNDGRQETRYSTGRVRLKDKDGNILLDRMY